MNIFLRNFDRNNRYVQGAQFVIFLILVLIWRYAFDDINWRFPYWVVFTATVTVFTPWEFLLSKKRRKALRKKFKKGRKLIIKVFYKLEDLGIDLDFFHRLRVGIVFMLLISIFTSIFLAREVSVVRRFEWFLISNVDFLKQSIGFEHSLLGARLDAYPQRYLFLFIFILSLISVRQVFKYVFRSTLKQIAESIETYLKNRPSAPKILSLFLLLIFIMGGFYIVFARDTQSFILEAEDEQILIVDLDFDVVTMPKELLLTGTIIINEEDHVYKEGGCWEESGLEECRDEEGIAPFLLTRDYIEISKKISTIEHSEDQNEASVSQDIKYVFEADNYFFPINYYSGTLPVIAGKNPESDREFLPWEGSQLNVTINDSKFAISPADRPGGFIIGYTNYYKLLVFVVIATIFFFLIVIVRTQKREQINGLSVGVIAIIVTLKEYLIPQEISSSPILLDQILLVFIALLFVIFLYKYGELDNS